MRIQLDVDSTVPRCTIRHKDENPQSTTTHWLQEDPQGTFETPDGKRWRAIRSHYRKPDPKEGKEK